MLVDQIHEFAKASPNRTAVVRNGVPFSYFAFSNLIQFMIGLLEQRKLPPGKTAVIPATDPLVEWLLVLAMRWLGLNTIVVNSLDQAASLELKDCACVVTLEIYKVTSEDISKFPAGVQFITIFNSHFQNQTETLLPLQPFLHQFGGHIVFTSGTTGIYKKVLFDGVHDAIRNDEQAMYQSFTDATVFQGIDFALWTGSGYRNPAAVWSKGGCVVLDRRPDWHKHFLSHGVNFAVLTPKPLRELLQSRDESDVPNHGLTLIVAGGFLSSHLAQKAFLSLTSDIRITYASTEVIGPILRSRYRTMEDLFWLKPMLEDRVQIADENREECPIGQEGDIRVLLRDVDAKSYMDDDSASARAFRGAYFYPGDRAVQREEGCIKILGRSADVVVIAGGKFAVSPIERSIQDALGVDDVCVFSGPNEQGEDIFFIAVESQQDLSTSDLQKVAGRFGQFDKVSVVVFRNFPRTETGTKKVNRVLLKDHIFGALSDRKKQ